MKRRRRVGEQAKAALERARQPILARESSDAGHVIDELVVSQLGVGRRARLADRPEQVPGVRRSPAAAHPAATSVSRTVADRRREGRS